MDDRRFDSIARTLASSSSRRAALKGLLGIGGILAAGLVGTDRADAARRGFSGPSILPPPPPICISDGDACPSDLSQCCSGYCCKLINDPGPGVCCTPPPP